MKKNAAVGVLALCVLAVVGLSGAPVSRRSVTATTANVIKKDARGSAAEMRVYIDPVTGEFVPPPVDDPIQNELPQSVIDATSTSHDGLVMEVNPRGGVVVNTRGRFMHMQTATIDEDGTLTSECDTDLARKDEVISQDEEE